MNEIIKAPYRRMRRLRYNSVVRKLIRETSLNIDDLILPFFIKHGHNLKNPIKSMPGCFQLSLDKIVDEVKEAYDLGIRMILLFGIPETKDELGSDAYSDTGIIQRAIPIIKKAMPDILIISDLCFCEYTNHGHCGVITYNEDKYDLDNDKTLELLVKQAISHAKAGAGMVAPSGMIDGMVGAIRDGLDAAGFEHVPILSYSVKYASSLYGPFREAAEGAPAFGDRRTYQMDIANVNEAIREAELDIQEGADMLMVKPALAYLDVITKIKSLYPEMPLGAYQVSGEYSMIKAAAEKGWLNEKNVALETLIAIKRAGADFIITYYAKEAAKWIKEGI